MNDWRLELRRVNSNEVWTSYADLEPRLIVTSLKPNVGEKLNPHRFPQNLFRDSEIKTVIQNFRHQAFQVLFIFI